MSDTTEDDEGYAEAVAMLLEKADAQQIHDTSEGFMCCCILPGHPDDGTPSFAINATSGLWRCYGCKEKGSLARLTSIILGIPIKDARGALLKYESRRSFPTIEARVKQEQTTMPEGVLIPFRDNCPVYMVKDRGLPKAFLRRFEVGFDKSSASVVMPIRSISGKLVGLTRRTVQSNVFPKYHHSFGWKKTDHLYLGWYGTQEARKHRATTVIFTEGHIDALNVWHLAETSQRFQKALRKLPPFVAGVAIMGSVMSETQAKIAVRYLNCSCAILAFDNDKAGEEAINGTEYARKRREKYGGKEPIGAVEALSTAGCRMIYRLAFDAKDPGELTENSRVSLEDLT